MIRGTARGLIMRLYFRGEITWHEAAEMIGVTTRTIARWTPAGFYWQAKRDQHVEKLTMRAIANKAKPKRRKPPKLIVIKGDKA